MDELDDTAQTEIDVHPPEEQHTEDTLEHDDEPKQKKRKKSRPLSDINEFQEEVNMRGIVYISRLPPKMKPHHVRRILSEYGVINRIYCATESEQSRLARKKRGGNRHLQFREAWVEFANKKEARKATTMLNGAQMGGTRRCPWYYDIWNMRYLSKFKWHHINEEVQQRKREADKKLRLQVQQAKIEANTFLENRGKSLVNEKVKERLEKKNAKIKNKAQAKPEGKSEQSELGEQQQELKPLHRNFKQQRVYTSKSHDLLDDSFLQQFMGETPEKSEKSEKKFIPKKRKRDA